MSKSRLFSVTSNTYRDVIISATLANVDNVNTYLGQKYNHKRPTIVHIKGGTFHDITLPENLTYCMTTSDNKHIYANKLAIEQCPSIIDGIIYSSLVHLIVHCTDQRFIILIREKSKRRLSMPGGTRLPDETSEECAYREVYEETGILTNTLKCKKLIPKGSFKQYGTWSLGLRWPHKTVLYTLELTLDRKEFNSMYSHKTDEVLSVVVVPEYQLSKVDTRSRDIYIMSQLLTKTYLTTSLNDRKTPKYLKEFVIT